MKMLFVLTLALLAFEINAQTERESIGAYRGGGYGMTSVNPATGMPYGYISAPAGVTTLSGQMNQVKAGLLYLDAERQVERHTEIWQVVITNYPAVDSLTSGQKIHADVRRIGVFKDDQGNNLEFYEYFNLEDYRDKIEQQAEADAAAKAELKKAADEQRAEQGKTRALKLNQDAAAKGDAYGLLRMAERYRDGDGIEKDSAKAKEYFQKAVEAGSPSAAAELESLNKGAK
jgi:TPR repeat protein